ILERRLSDRQLTLRIPFEGSGVKVWQQASGSLVRPRGRLGRIHYWRIGISVAQALTVQPTGDLDSRTARARLVDGAAVAVPFPGGGVRIPRMIEQPGGVRKRERDRRSRRRDERDHSAASPTAQVGEGAEPLLARHCGPQGLSAEGAPMAPDEPVAM